MDYNNVNIVYPKHESFRAMQYDGSYDSFVHIIKNLREFYASNEFMPIGDLGYGNRLYDSINELYSGDNPNYEQLYKKYKWHLPIIASSQKSAIKYYDVILIKDDELHVLDPEVFKFIFVTGN